MQHLPGWHTYWQNPGDAGMPTSIVWHLAAGWSASEIEWPAPERLPSGPLASYGYVGELVLPMVLTPPPDWDGRAAAHLSASVSWLACSASCIPEKAELSLDLPAPADPRAVPLLRHFLNRTPEAFAFTTAQVRRSADRFELVLSPAAGGEFFPEMEELIDPGEPPRVHREGHATVWSTKLGERGRHLPPGAHILGVWIEKGRRPRRVDALLVAS
jgi:thiol:disulfide interchange protein DsbD